MAEATPPTPATPSTSCPVCAADEGRRYCEKHGAVYLRCPRCSHVYLETFPTEEELTELYATRKSPHGSEAKAAWDFSDAKYRFFYRPILQTAEELNGVGRLLDVGCSNGAFLHAAGRSGWEATGVELETHSFEVARARGLRVHNQDLASCSFPDESFDVVTMWQLIEHLRAPRELLAEIRRVLRPNGVLALSTPNVDSIGWWLLKQEWKAVEPEVHLHLFSSSSLERAVEDAGFRVAKLQTLDVKPNTIGQWVRSLRPSAARKAQPSVAQFTASRSPRQLAMSFLALRAVNRVLSAFDGGEDIYGYFRKR